LQDRDARDGGSIFQTMLAADVGLVEAAEAAEVTAAAAGAEQQLLLAMDSADTSIIAQT